MLQPDVLRAEVAGVEDEQAAGLVSEIERLQGDLTALERVIGRLVDTAEQGADVPEVVKRLQERQAERKRITAQLADARRRLATAQAGPIPDDVIAVFCEEQARILAMGRPETVRDVLDEVGVAGVAWADGRAELAYRSPWTGVQGRVDFRW